MHNEDVPACDVCRFCHPKQYPCIHYAVKCDGSGNGALCCLSGSILYSDKMWPSPLRLLMTLRKGRIVDGCFSAVVGWWTKVVLGYIHRSVVLDSWCVCDSVV